MILISMFFTLKIIYSKKNVSIKMLIEADVVVLMWNYTHAVLFTKIKTDYRIIGRI